MFDDANIAATYEDIKQQTYSPPFFKSELGVGADDVVALYNSMTPDEMVQFDALLKAAPSRMLMGHQITPWDEDFWFVKLLIGGRGTGKTVDGATATREHLRMEGRKARVGIGAPTTSDVRDTCFEGETGLITMFPNEFKYYNRSLGEARHINGGYVKGMGTEKPKRWNGPQWSFLWFDELALCNQAAWDDANMGLRLGSNPRAVCTTTPKNKRWVKKLAQEKTTYVPQYFENGRRRLPTTYDNPYLPEARVNWLKNKYGGSRLGRQELLGQFVDDIDGAMWSREWFKNPTTDKLPRMVKKVVAVDPAGSVNRRTADENSLSEEQRQNQQKNADTAIAVVGLGEDGKFYVLAVKSGQWTPGEWAKEVIRMYYKWQCDKIIAEKNYGGLMVERNIRVVDEYDTKTLRHLKGRYLPIVLVTASQGKHIRAEPVATLYEQGRVIHIIPFAPAEDQMCAFIDAEHNEGADMVDALVWAIWELAGFDAEKQSMLYVPQPGNIPTLIVCH